MIIEDFVPFEKELSVIVSRNVSDSNEDLNLFVQEITKNVIDNEDFCLEYAYYVTRNYGRYLGNGRKLCSSW